MTFQTDNPMVPFLRMENAEIMKSLMCLFIPKTIIKKMNIPYEVPTT